MTEIVKGKVIMVGDTKVGKTSLINSFNHVEDGMNTQPTVPVSTVTCNVKLNDKDIHFNIWDTAGQETYKSLLPMYFRNSQLAVLVFDVSNKESYDNIDNWIAYIKEHIECKIIIVGNKDDLDVQINLEEAMQQFAEKNYEFYVTSAKTGNGIDLLFNSIAFAVDQTGNEQSDQIDKPVSTFQQPISKKEHEKSCC